MKDGMISNIENIMTGWFHLNVRNADAVFFYATYAIQKGRKVINGNASSLKEEWIGMSSIIVMTLKTREYDLENWTRR